MFPLLAETFTPVDVALFVVVCLFAGVLGVLRLHLAQKHAHEREELGHLSQMLSNVGLSMPAGFAMDLATLSLIEAAQKFRRIVQEATTSPEKFMATLDKDMFAMLESKLKTPDGLAAVKKVVDKASAAAGPIAPAVQTATSSIEAAVKTLSDALAVQKSAAATASA